jgi:aspartyl/asparaginyl-tRNA synthetase
MDKSDLSVRAILAGQAPTNAPVTIKGWVRTRRDSKAGISFVHLSDGSSFHPLQVMAPNALPNYADEVLKLTDLSPQTRRGDRARCAANPAAVERRPAPPSPFPG